MTQSGGQDLDFIDTCGTCFQCTPKCWCACCCASCVLDYDLHKSQHPLYKDDYFRCQLAKFGVGYAICCGNAAQGMMLNTYNEPRKTDSTFTQCAKACCAPCMYTYHRDNGHLSISGQELPVRNAIVAQPVPAVIRAQPQGMRDKDQLLY